MASYRLGTETYHSGGDLMISAWNGQDTVWLRIVREALVEHFGSSENLDNCARQFARDHIGELEIACNQLVLAGRLEPSDQAGLGPHQAVKILEGGVG
jgi:hypothetical protein